jgi:CheY-like chemotaxis protein
LVLLKYKERKLRILVANDSHFQIFVVAKSLNKLSFVEHIDEASNGQEALELVIKNEKELSKKG